MASRKTAFISYKRDADIQTALTIHDHLEKIGYDALLDVKDIPASVNWEAYIEQEIKARNYFLLILSPTTFESEWVCREVQLATENNKPVIPLTTREFDWDRHIPPDMDNIRKINGVSYSVTDSETAIRKLIKAFEELDPPSPRYLAQLEQKLQEKYQKQHTRFSVVPYESHEKTAFYRCTAEVLLDEIEHLLENKSQMQGNIVIGVVCGATLRGIAHYFWDHKPYSLTSKQRQRLTFVSLNTAGLSNRLQFSGMIQAVFLAEAFEGASHSVELPSLSDRQWRQEHPPRVDLLLCSAGGRNDGFLSDWLGDRGITFSADIVGDFCLWPINANGQVVINDPRLTDVITELSLKPVFQELADIQKNKLCDRVVFPITSNRRHYPGQEVSPEDMTDKEPITRTVLESGIVSRCILDHVLAENILWNTNAELCGYHLLTVSQETATEITYSALRQKDKEVVPVRVIRAPQELLDREYHHTPSNTSSSPYEIIVSDPPCSADENSCHEREFPVCVDGQVKNIWLRPGVRKPGFWSTTTIRVARKVIGKMKRTDLNILDLGCGSGIVGLVLGQHPNVRHVLFSDIDPEAIECTRENIPYWSSGQVTFDTRVGDLFDVISSTEFFDLIVFTPPFYPAFMKDDPEYRAMGLIATDIGGPTGMELAERFAAQVKQYLAPGGVSITYMADYVGYEQIRNALRHAGLKTSTQKRDILYPYEPRHGFAPANEIRWRTELERFYQHRFGDHSFDNRQFLGFKIIHLIAEQPE